MENYLPFLSQHWRSIGLIGVGLATGVVMGRRSDKERNRGSQSFESVGSFKAAKKHEKIVSVAEEVDGKNEEDDEDDNQLADDYNTSPILFEYAKPSEIDSIQRSAEFYQRMNQRRSVRQISADPVALEIIENIVKTAGKC